MLIKVSLKKNHEKYSHTVQIHNRTIKKMKNYFKKLCICLKELQKMQIFIGKMNQQYTCEIQNITKHTSKKIESNTPPRPPPATRPKKKTSLNKKNHHWITIWNILQFKDDK